MVALDQFGFQEHVSANFIFSSIIRSSLLLMIYREFLKRQEDMLLENMEHIRIDQKQILNPIWANTYQAKEKRLGDTHRKSTAKPLADK